MEAVSHTALWAAAVRAAETIRPDALFADPAAGFLAGPLGPELMARYDRPGTADFIAIRTRYVDDALVRAAPRQVVLLAAGLDMRASRLAWPDGTALYEVDHAELFAWKEARLAEYAAASDGTAAEPSVDVHRVGADLAGDAADWTDALRAAGWDAEQPTTWVTEGLLFYLTEETAGGLLTTLADLSAPGSVLIGDVVSQQTLLSPMAAEALAKLAEDGAPWTFGTDDPETFLAASGWKHEELLMPGEPGAHFDRWPFPPLPREIPLIPRNFLFTAAH
ncbi:class I SAM-dependent methyltransferase [Yinghuangia seranimata]|uniref:class I SAM-dependent methyltransferase n=1 Tax=Yinghuangia seranimata TaxID=408067 RepID=UPI00248C3996|nr:SAM-dependent methyltransferase [Yinghuangia seranimata]MDI2128460.1 SAM-dependent methyltransferase [Yinghuangia seranimata]